MTEAEAKSADAGSSRVGKKPIPRTVKEFVGFTFRQIVLQRKWVLLPLWVILAVVAVMLVLTGNSHLLPVIYLAF